MHNEEFIESFILEKVAAHVEGIPHSQLKDDVCRDISVSDFTSTIRDLLMRSKLIGYVRGSEQVLKVPTDQADRPLCGEAANFLQSCQKEQSQVTVEKKKVDDSWRKESSRYVNFCEFVKLLQQRILPEHSVGVHPQYLIDDVTSMMERLEFNSEEWNQFTHFHQSKYTRTLVGYDSNFTLLLLSWNKGQSSPVHDHAGSSCWVKVLTGTLTEVKYSMTPDPETGKLKELSVVNALRSEVCYINDTMGLHVMGNRNPNEVCVSLHVYSPAFNYCNIFTLQGVPKRVSMLAATAPDPDDTCLWVHNQIPEKKDSQISIQDFVQFLRNKNKKNDLSDEFENEIKAKLENVALSNEEWNIFTHFSDHKYTRNLVYTDNNFSLFLLCWMGNQSTPQHIHGKDRKAWFRVLLGSLFHQTVSTGEKYIMNIDSKTFAEEDGCAMHCVGNTSDTQLAVSLHLYTPPYKEVIYSCCQGTNQSLTIPIVSYQKHEDKSNICPGGRMYSNLDQLSQLLEFEFKQKNDNSINCRVIDILERIYLNKLEIDNFKVNGHMKERNIILHQSENFIMTLRCWEAGEGSAIRDCKCATLFNKVLQGSILDMGFSSEGGKPVRVHTMGVNCISMVELGRANSIHNIGDHAVTLHIYAPPCSFCLI